MAPVQDKRPIARTLVRSQLVRILKSTLFAESQRMARFLEFSVEETLNGRAQQVKENVIGMHVFDRPSGYDPRTDPIVRVEARRLRAKLSAYYERDGKPDDLIIELPKGQYSVVFRGRSPEKRLQSGKANTVAVLPFTNLSAHAETDFLSDGLTEDLIGALTRVSNLRVSAWTSAARMKDEQDNLDTIRERLDVTFVVRGSIRKSQERIRVLAHLIDTSTKQYIWSETFDREFRDIFAIQDEITNAIVVALRAKLPMGDEGLTNESLISEGSSPNLECYQLCLKGRFHARERTCEGLGRSALCFEQATRVDPASASAYAGLADTFTLQAEYGYADGPGSMRKAKAVVERALTLNPASAEAQASHGLILALYDRSWNEAENAFRRSLELNPSYAAAHHWYSMNHLAMLGRFTEAESEIEMAIKLDPLSPVVMEGRGFLRFLRRDFSEAIAIYMAIVAADPSFYKAYTSMGRAYLQMGEPHRAIEMLERGLGMAGETASIFGALGQAYGVAGQRAAAVEVMEKLIRISAIRPVPSTCFALVHLGLGKKDLALTWLELGVQRRESTVVALGVHAAYDELRDEDRFKALVK